jgi:hypothetical protein
MAAAPLNNLNECALRETTAQKAGQCPHVSEKLESRKCRMLVIAGAAMPVEPIGASAAAFAVIDVVPHIAASETR